jgi:hypothetical protein
MAYKLDAPSKTEKDVLHQLRQAIAAEVSERDLTSEQFADLLNILPSGARVLLSQREWPVEVGLRVADALGIRLEVRITRI